MSEKFEVGDVVQLKSGGPRLTVFLVERQPQRAHVVFLNLHGSHGFLSANKSQTRPESGPTLTELHAYLEK